MVGEIWGLKSSGLIQTQAQADEYNKLDLKYLNGGVWTPGDVMYEDLNGDGKIDRGSNVLGDTGDYTIIGITTPRYQYTINGSIGWKGLNLSVMMQGVGKRDSGHTAILLGLGLVCTGNLLQGASGLLDRG